MKNSGPPKCTCSVCNEVVLKSTTKHVGNGLRACTKHDGVEEKVNRLKLEEKGRLKNLTKKATERRILNDKKSYTFTPPTPSCFCCGTKGFPEKELNYQILMMWKLIERVTGERINPLNPSESVKDTVRASYMKTYGFMPVALTIVNAEKIPEDVRQKIIKDRMLRDFAPAFFICHDCMSKHNIYSYIDTPKIDMNIKNIMLLGGIMNDIMEKDIDKIIKEHK